MDLYTDYLLSSFGLSTATGMSAMLDKAVSHDNVTRFISGIAAGSQALWQHVKPLVRELEKSTQEQGVLTIDDFIIEKAHSKQNGLISVHYDHSKDRYVKGINQVSALLVQGNAYVPVAYELVEKTHRSDLKTKKAAWKSGRTRNEMFRGMVGVSVQSKVRFNYVLCESWYTNSDNIKHVLQLRKHLIGAMKRTWRWLFAWQTRKPASS